MAYHFLIGVSIMGAFIGCCMLVIVCVGIMSELSDIKTALRERNDLLRKELNK